MNSPNNPTRISKALQTLKQAERELEAAISDAKRPQPNPLPKPVKVRRFRSMRRIKS
jgi:hypothetical protein